MFKQGGRQECKTRRFGLRPPHGSWKIILTEGALRNQSVHQGESEFFVSDVPAKFKEIAERFLGRKNFPYSQSELDELTNEWD